MSVTTSSYRTDGVRVGYRPSRRNGDNRIPESVEIELTGSAHAWVNLSIEDARTVMAALPRVLAEHATTDGDPDLAKGLEVISRQVEFLNSMVLPDAQAVA